MNSVIVNLLYTELGRGYPVKDLVEDYEHKRLRYRRHVQVDYYIEHCNDVLDFLYEYRVYNHGL